MSQKRPIPESFDAVEQQPAKRHRGSSASAPEQPELPELPETSNSEAHGTTSKISFHQKQEGKVNRIYGQRGAFPELEDGDHGPDLIYGEDPSDAFEYLRMVRSEARNVPYPLVAPEKPISTSMYDEAADENVATAGGFYHEGAYTALPTAPKDLASPRYDVEAQRTYYDSLLLRFAVIRATLKCTPPLSAIESLTSSHPISFLNSKRAHSEWKRLVSRTDPQMAQIACMDIDSLLRLLRLLTGLMPAMTRSRSVERIRRFGAWAWATLGKCREVGQLGNEEVGEIRELGKIAAGALYGFKDRSGIVYGDPEQAAGKAAPEDEEDLASSSIDKNDQTTHALDDSGDANKQGQADKVEETVLLDMSTRRTADQALEEAKKRLEEELYEDDEAPEDSDLEDELDFENRARATLNMILTIIGELYGQRDLLDLRDVWVVDESSSP